MRAFEAKFVRLLFAHVFAASVSIGLAGQCLADDQRDNGAHWEPRSIALKLPVGTGDTSVVTLVPERNLEHVSLHVISDRREAITVDPSYFDSLERGKPVKVTVLTSTPKGAKSGDSFDAFIAIVDDHWHGTGPTAFGGERDNFDHSKDGLLSISVRIDENRSSFSNLTLYANPTSPLLLGFQAKKSGDFVILTGQKDSQGNTLSFNGITSTNGSSGQTISQIDSAGRPLQALLSNGVALNFTWTSDAQGQVQVTGPNGAALGTVPLNFATAAGTSPSSQAMGFRPARAVASTSPIAATAAAANLSDINVTVTDSSGNPVSGASVGGMATPGGISLSYPLFFTAGAPGTYLGYFVNDPAVIPLQNAEQSCETALKTVNTYCGALAPIATGMLFVGCPAVAAAALPLGPVASGEVLLSCESAFADIQSACTVGSAPHLEAACGTLFAVPSLFHAGTISLDVKATLDGVSAEKPVTAASNAPSVDIALVLPVATSYSGTALLTGTKVEEFQQYDDQGNPTGTLPCGWELTASVSVKFAQTNGQWAASVTAGNFAYAVTDVSAGADVCFDYSWDDVPLPPVPVGPTPSGNIQIPLTFQGSSPFQALLTLDLLQAQDKSNLSGTATYSFSRTGGGAVTSNVENAEGAIVLTH
jgi:hypothetical protein